MGSTDYCSPVVDTYSRHAYMLYINIHKIHMFIPRGNRIRKLYGTMKAKKFPKKCNLDELVNAHADK